MSNVTFRADEKTLLKARLKAQNDNKSLAEVFNEFLMNYANAVNDPLDYKNLMEKFKYAKVGKKFTREEMNER
ncbi:antitoxin [Leptospira idonii]|uniref:Antitoxin n=1 Tax=Leptospira idonii TaxID=1193500 RepID=A0A4R9M0Q6_9LEPT|nr:antitoxin [Leptospira idonii]TGN20260.1 antitoxin [Leptospira idonii]